MSIRLTCGGSQVRVLYRPPETYRSLRSGMFLYRVARTCDPAPEGCVERSGICADAAAQRQASASSSPVSSTRNIPLLTERYVFYIGKQVSFHNASGRRFLRRPDAFIYSFCGSFFFTHSSAKRAKRRVAGPARPPAGTASAIVRLEGGVISRTAMPSRWP